MNDAPTLQLAEQTRWVAMRLACILAGTVVWLGAAAIMDPQQHGWIQAVPAFVILLACLSAAATLVIRFRPAIATPLPLFFTASGIVFGFGPLFYFFQPSSPYGSARGRLPVEGADLLRVELLNAVGLLAVIGGVVLATTLWLRLADSRPQRDPAVPAERAAWPQVSQAYLLRASLVFSTLAIVLRATAWVTGIKATQWLPGFLQPIDYVGSLAVLTSAMYAARSRRTAAWALVLLPVTVEAINGLLAFRKSLVLYPLMWGGFGAYLGGKSWRFLTAAAAAGLVAFAILYPVTSVGRRLVWAGAGLSPAQFYASLASRGVEPTEASNPWFMWSRFNYTPVQRAVMREYEEGRPGRTLAQMPWLLVPRALAPSKPVLDYGRQVNQLLFGKSTSSTSPTAFGEAYWNGGWLYLIMCALIVGVSLIPAAQVCVWLLSRSSLAAWVAASSGLYLGLTPQNFFSVMFVGTTLTFGVWAAAVWLWLSVTRQLRNRMAS